MRGNFKNLGLFIVFIILVGFILTSCGSKKRINYIDSDLPTLKKKLFAPGFISKKDRAEFGSIFSKDAKEFYYADDTHGKAIIMYTKLEENKWITPEPIHFDTTYSYNDPFLSPDEQRLYYISNQPRGINDTISDIDIWYSEKTETGWSSPINAGPEINSDYNEYYISFTSNGTMYFSSNKENAPKKRKRDFEIYNSRFVNGEFQKPIKLPETINTKMYEADVFIAPDESYIIFCSVKRSGYGNGDLYISFKNKKGEWTTAQNMGTAVNSDGHEICPFVTHDRKFLFFTSSQDIYWISTQIIDQLRASSQK